MSVLKYRLVHLFRLFVSSIHVSLAAALEALLLDMNPLAILEVLLATATLAMSCQIQVPVRRLVLVALGTILPEIAATSLEVIIGGLKTRCWPAASTLDSPDHDLT